MKKQLSRLLFLIPFFFIVSCEEDSVHGCIDSKASNYNPKATLDNNSCVYQGCTDVDACNYDINATKEDGSCAFAEINKDCNGLCNNDEDDNGVCDEDEGPGCMDKDALNYNPKATFDDACLFYSPDNLTSLDPTSKLIFEDNFEGVNLDYTKWTHEEGNGMWGWGNGELQYYHSSNTSVSYGTAKITAKKETVGGMDYTSSRIKTDGKFTFRYGKVQARIKTVKGQGLWPAFWLLPSGGDWPCDGEIDIMEQGSYVGGNNEAKITTGAAHIGTCPYQTNINDHVYKYFKVTSADSYADDFHIYEIRWEPNKIEWYVDNQKIATATPEDFPGKTWPFNKNDWYIILNLAIDRIGPNSITQFPSQIEVDWVRVYELH
jgi:beta-glucanase (GH16 family)